MVAEDVVGAVPVVVVVVVVVVVAAVAAAAAEGVDEQHKSPSVALVYALCALSNLWAIYLEASE